MGLADGFLGRMMLPSFLRVSLCGLMAAIGLCMVAMAALACWAGLEIASPARRGLQDYHREFLSQPTLHGVEVKAFALDDGTPCLLCVPDALGALGERGVRVRSELEMRGLKLAEPGRILGTVVLVHGRRGRKEDYLLIAERLCAVGFRCLLFDLPGHGEHPGAVSGYGMLEAELPRRVLGEAAERFDFDPQPAGLFGISMGGSVAMHAAALPETPWRALVVIASFDAFSPVVEHQGRRWFGEWCGPLWGWLSGGVYEMRTGVPMAEIQPAVKAASLAVPVLIAHGSVDRVVPVESGRRLFEALPVRLEKRWIEIPDADHDNVLITAFPVYAEVAEWMLRHAHAAE